MAPQTGGETSMPAVIGAGELWRYVEAVESAEKVRPRIAETLQTRAPTVSAFSQSPPEVFVREIPEWFGTSERPDVREVPAYGQLIDPFTIGMYLIPLEAFLRGLLTRSNEDGFWDRFEGYKDKIFEEKWKQELRVEEKEEEKEEEIDKKLKELEYVYKQTALLKASGYRPRFEVKDGEIKLVGYEKVSYYELEEGLNPAFNNPYRGHW